MRVSILLRDRESIFPVSGPWTLSSVGAARRYALALLECAATGAVVEAWRGPRVKPTSAPDWVWRMTGDDRLVRIRA